MVGAPKVELQTTIGPIVVELYVDHAPKTCKNFIELTKRGYYNNTPLHRIIKDFMIQGGDPTGTGRGGESMWGGKFEDELHKDLRHTGAGILSMANAGPNTNGSQKHTIFGRVYSGMTTVQRLGNVQTDSLDRPTSEVKITTAKFLG